MISVQYTLRGILESVPYNLTTKKEAVRYARLITTIHHNVVQSTGEPKEHRQGASLFLAAQFIRGIMKTTTNAFYQSAIIYHELAKRGHYFVEGNKRTAHCVAKAHLLSEGYHFKIRYCDAERFIKKLAAGEKTIQDTVEWLYKHSIKYKTKTKEMYLNKIIKEITVDEKRGRPRKNA